MDDNIEVNNTDKTMSEISETLSSDALNQFAQIVQNQVDASDTAPQNPEHQALLGQLETLIEATGKQQITTDFEAQNTISQAAGSLVDSRRLAKLSTDAQELHQAALLGLANLQTNMQEYQQTLKQMKQDCHTQQVATDLNVIGSLQQAIGSMATAQSCLLQSQSIDKIFKDIDKCDDSLKQISSLNP